MNWKWLALMPLPDAAVLEFTKHAERNEDSSELIAISSSPHLSDVVSKRLLETFVPSANWRALRVVNDPDLLTKTVSEGSDQRVASACANVHTPDHALVEALASKAPEAVLRVLCNPSTPLREKVEYLTPEIADRLVDVGSSKGHAVVRAGELVLQNPWMCEEPGRWSAPIRRAIASSPDATLEQLQCVRETSTAGLKFVKRHPAILDMRALGEWALEDLALLGSPAADIFVIQDPNCTLQIARTMVARDDKDQVEPQVLARILARFGLDAVSEITRYHFASTRTDSAKWLQPSAEFLGSIDDAFKGTLADLNEARAMLGADADLWSMFFDLRRNWKHSGTMLANAVRKLSR
jgi:hypothetical protein